MKFTVKTVLLLILALAAVGLFLLWLEGPEEPKIGPKPRPPDKRPLLYLGLVAPRTGLLSPLGQGLIQGARMAVEAANADPAGRARPVRLLIEDEAASNLLPPDQRLAKDPRVSVFIGHLMERSLEETKDLYIRSGRPVLLPVLSSSDVSFLGRGWFYRLMSSDSAQAHALAEFARSRLAAVKALVIHEDSKYGRTAAEAFASGLRQGQAGEARLEVYPERPEDLLELSTRAVKSAPDVVFLAVHARPAVYLVQSLAQAGLKTTLLGTHALALSDVVPILERLSKRVFVCLPFDPEHSGPRGRAFTKEYETRRHRFPSWLSALSHDAAALAVKAADWAGGRPERIKLYLDRLDSPRKAFQGVAGGYYFKAGGQGVGPVYIVRVSPGLVSRLP